MEVVFLRTFRQELLLVTWCNWVLLCSRVTTNFGENDWVADLTIASVSECDRNNSSLSASSSVLQIWRWLDYKKNLSSPKNQKKFQQNVCEQGERAAWCTKHPMFMQGPRKGSTPKGCDGSILHCKPVT